MYMINKKNKALKSDSENNLMVPRSSQRIDRRQFTNYVEKIHSYVKLN